VIDLGPDDARRPIMQAVEDAGLEPIIGDGIEDALAGVATDRDGLLLAAAMQDAEHSFGRLKCSDAVKSAKVAIGLAAQRQAAGLPVPELNHAWAYLLLCADKDGDINAATLAATRLRAIGGSSDIDAVLLARYPDIDAVSDREVVELDVAPEVAAATIYVDFQPVSGTHLVLPAGEHVIAAAAGRARRGYVAGAAIPSQRSVAIPMPDQTGAYSALAARVAGWKGKLPPDAELAAVVQQTHARVALIHHGDVVEAWGHSVPAVPMRRLGDDGIRPLPDVDRLARLVADRVMSWNEHAPEPDQPLLVESLDTRAKHTTQTEQPTKWWIYATIGGALLAGAIVIYAHDQASDTQRVELRYP
jgi:hypothetical protein